MRTRVEDVRELIRSVGTDTAVAMLLAIPEEDAAAILAGHPARNCAEMIQGIADVRQAAARAILQMFGSGTAARATAHLRSDTAAALLADTPTFTALRILDRSHEQIVARLVKHLAVRNSVRLFKAMNSWRAAAVLGHAKPSTTAELLRADTELASAILRNLDESDRQQVVRHMANGSVK